MRLRSRLRVVASLASKGLGGADAVLWSPGRAPHVTSARVLLVVGVASFDVIVW